MTKTKRFLSKLTFLSLLIFACSLGAFAQGGSTTVAVPAEYLNWPNQASQYRVCSGFNASGAPCTPATIYTDLTLASSVTQPVTVPSTGLLTINATPGPYTLQFFNASGGSGYFNYNAVCRITWQGSAGTTGPKYQFTGPSAPTAVTVGMNSVVTATTVISASAVAFSSAVANTGTVTAATNFTDTVDLGVVNGVNSGTVQLQAAANGAGTLTIQPGSYCTVQ